MKTIIAFVILFAITSALPRHGTKFPRKYFPEEEREDSFKSLLWEDENGHYHVEKLDVQFMERSKEPVDVELFLFTEDNPTKGELIMPDDFESLKSSKYFDPDRLTVFIIHGWNNDNTSDVNSMLKGTILKYHDVNVFVVNWGTTAWKNYLTAKAAVTEVGSKVGNFINKIIEHYRVSSKTFSLIGHSLGAHAAGCAGALVTDKVNNIIGLDPALPLFSLKKVDNRLDESDADHVQIIHTNGGLLGFRSSIGHADFFPNGGSSQPGCGLDIAGICAHSRSYKYLKESIEMAEFKAHYCDNHENYNKGLCYDNEVSFLGMFHVDKTASGDYYLNTNSKAPYALEEKENIDNINK